MSHSAEPDPDEAPTRPMRPESLRHPEPGFGRLIGGRYRLDREIASGGFGVVYEGHYKILDQERRVAIKLMKPSAGLDLATLDSPNLQRFEQEIRTLTLLKGSNICEVIDGGVDAGTMFLVMEYADGGSLKQAMQKSPNGRIPPKTALRWMHEAAQGLLAAEQNKREDGSPAPVYHRDIKPENLLLQDGHVVVADFGAARLGGPKDGITSENVPALWTPRYASPEQAIGIVDHRSDVYSLGTTFYHLLTGQPPDKRFADFEQRYSEAHDPSRICPEVPKALGAVVRKMTEPNPAHRYQSFAEVVAAIENLMHRRAPAVFAWVLASVVVAAALLGGAWLMGMWSPADDDRDPERSPRHARELCEKQHGEVQSVLAAGSWERLDALRTAFAKLQQDIEANRLRIDGIMATVDPDRPMPLTLPRSQKSLDRRLKELRLDQDSLVARRRELDSLKSEPRLATASIQELRAALERARPDDKVPYRAGLVELASEVEAVLREAEEKRKRSIEAAAAEFVAAKSTATLQTVRDRAARLAKDFQAQREGDLERSAVYLAKIAAEAKAIDAFRPLTAQTLDAQIEQLDQLRAQWDRSTADATIGERERAWVDAYRALLCRHHLETLSGAFDQQRKQCEQHKRDYLGLAADARNDATRNELERRISTLNKCRAQLRALYARLDVASAPLFLEADIPALPAETADWREAYAAERVPPNTTERDPALAEAFDAIDAARDKLCECLDSPTATSGEAAKLSQALAGAKSRLEQARRLLDACTAAESAVGQAETSCAELRRSLAIDVQFPKVEARKAAALRAIDELWHARTERVSGVRSAFEKATDAAALTNVAVAARAAADELAKCKEDELVARLHAIEQDAKDAQQLVAALPKWDTTIQVDGKDCLDRLARAGDVVRDVESSARRSAALEQWWCTRRDAWIQRWCTAAVQPLVEMRAAAAKSGASAASVRKVFNALLVEHARPLRDHAVLGTEMTRALRDLDPLPEVVENEPRTAAPPPPGWNHPFVAPAGLLPHPMSVDCDECKRLFPADVLARAQAAGARLWYFEKRRSRGAPGKPGRPVFMAYCQDPAGKAWLVDVHPVTFGELLADQHGLKTEFNSMRAVADEQIAHFTSHEMAERFAMAVAKHVGQPGVEFTLPPKACYALFAARAADLSAVAPEHAPMVEPSTSDPLEPWFLLYTRRGVREWDRDGAQNGPIHPNAMRDDPREGDRKWNTGLRLALLLAPLASESR